MFLRRRDPQENDLSSVEERCGCYCFCSNCRKGHRLNPASDRIEPAESSNQPGNHWRSPLQGSIHRGPLPKLSRVPRPTFRTVASQCQSFRTISGHLLLPLIQNNQPLGLRSLNGILLLPANPLRYLRARE